MKSFIISSECDGARIACAARDVVRPIAVLQIAHGMAEHKERYFDFMEYLAARGIASYINDHRGHGESVQSQGDLGYFGKDGARSLLTDMNSLHKIIAEEYPETPKLMMGHSMGALAARAFFAEKRFSDGDGFSGLIITGNPGDNPMAKTALKTARKIEAKKGGHAHSAFLTLGMFVPFMLGAPSLKTRNAWICTDKAVVEKYDEDPLCGFEFTVNGYAALMELMLAANDESAASAFPDAPAAFFSGAKDPCMGGIKKLERAAQITRGRGHERVSVKTYPGMRHEILNERGKEQVYGDITDTIFEWLGQAK